MAHISEIELQLARKVNVQTSLHSPPWPCMHQEGMANDVCLHMNASEPRAVPANHAFLRPMTRLKGFRVANWIPGKAASGCLFGRTGQDPCMHVL